MPCPEDTKPQSANSSQQQLPDEKNPPKKTGWINGAMNVCKVLYKSASDFLVGENGVLTNLVSTSGTPSSKWKKSNSGNNNNGQVRACCIFYKNAPPTKDNEEENEQEQDSKRQMGKQIGPINLSYLKVQQNSTSGVPTPTATLVPSASGAKTKTETNSTNCCCVGTNKFSLRKFIKCLFKGVFNCCALQINITVAETN